MGKTSQVTVSIRACLVKRAQVCVFPGNDTHALIACRKGCLDDSFTVASIAFIHCVRGNAGSLEPTQVVIAGALLTGCHAVVRFGGSHGCSRERR